MTESDRRTIEIENVVLSEEEIKAAIFGAKHAKWNRLKPENKLFWNDPDEKLKSIQHESTNSNNKGSGS